MNNEMDKKIEKLQKQIYYAWKEIRSLKQWRNGNGARGAEVRLQYVEENQWEKNEMKAFITDIVNNILKQERNRASFRWDIVGIVSVFLMQLAMLSVMIWGGQ